MTPVFIMKLFFGGWDLLAFRSFGNGNGSGIKLNKKAPMETAPPQQDPNFDAYWPLPQIAAGNGIPPLRRV